MEKNAIFISEGAGFMAGTITSTLKNAAFHVSSISPDIKELSDAKDRSDLLILFLGDYLSTRKEFLIYLSDIVREEEKTLYVIGFRNEIETYYSIAPESKVYREIERPFQSEDLLVILEEYEKIMESQGLKKKILIVDDDGLFLRTASGWLSSKYHVSVVNSAMNAITYLANHKPDLILLDYEMPVTDGPQFLKMIKSEQSTGNIPVMFLTTKNDRDSVETSLALKPQGYLLKTMSSSGIISAIDDFFEKQK